MSEGRLRAIFAKTSGHCHFCGDAIRFDRRGWEERFTGSWEVDHVIQRDKGGGRGAENCLAACTPCNRLRWHRTGEQVRELLILGILAKREIRRKGQFGTYLTSMMKQRVVDNERRRIARAKPAIRKGPTRGNP